MGTRVSLPIFNIGGWNTVINFIITAAWILYITNAVNFMDNADGIAIMTSATTSAIFLLIAILNDQQLGLDSGRGRIGSQFRLCPL